MVQIIYQRGLQVRPNRFLSRPMPWVGPVVRFLLGALVLTLVIMQMSMLSSLLTTTRESLDLRRRYLLVESDGNRNTTTQYSDLDIERTFAVKWSPKDDHHHSDNRSVAEALAKNIRILCWVMTSPMTINTKAVHIKHTWGQRCSKLLFMSSEAEPTLPAIGLNTSEGRDSLSVKCMMAFRYIYKNHRDFDWFLKTDDDTYVIMENLRYFLSSENPQHPVYFGHHFEMYLEQGYHSGGAGYVISKEALRRFALLNGHCDFSDGNEDVKFGTCMELLGVQARDTRDKFGRERFLCFHPEEYLTEHLPSWYPKYHKNVQTNISDVSDYAISFHYMHPKHMYFLEFYLYHLRLHGIQFGDLALNQIKTSPETPLTRMEQNGDSKTKQIKPSPNSQTNQIKPDDSLPQGQIEQDDDLPLNQFEPDNDPQLDQIEQDDGLLLNQFEPDNDPQLDQIEQDDDLPLNQFEPGNDLQLDQFESDEDSLLMQAEQDEDLPLFQIEPDDMPTDGEDTVEQIWGGEDFF